MGTGESGHHGPPVVCHVTREHTPGRGSAMSLDQKMAGKIVMEMMSKSESV